MQTLNLEGVFQLAKKEIEKSEKNNSPIAKELNLSRQMISLIESSFNPSYQVNH